MREYIVQYERKETDNPKDKCDLCNHAIVGELVRCKDCRHAEQRKQMPKQVYCKRDMLRIYGEVRDDDDFCKWGERREE